MRTITTTMLKKILYMALCLAALSSYAQKEAANWYFGIQAGLNFEGCSPTVLTDSQMGQLEGCATISDSNGNLLLYTSGTEIYNSNHQLMQNGTGLLGSPSSSQSAIVIPKPGDATLYYVFAVDSNSLPNGLTYSTVDMSLDNGLGGVLPNEKNIQLETPVAEKLTAVYHGNGEDIWVISHRMGTNEFIAYLISATGVNPTPIVSPVGQAHIGGGLGNGAIGYLKASPDGNRLVCAQTFFNTGLEVFDFNRDTGEVGNAMLVNSGSTYGVEFSPNSKVLYANTNFSGPIYQYDLTQSDAASIQNSKILIASSNYSAGMQLAIDGRLYIAQCELVGFNHIPKDYLSVIKQPNNLGVACNYVQDDIYLNGKQSTFGLPPFITSYFQYNLEYEPVCFGQETQLTIETRSEITSIEWDFGDPDSNENTSTELVPGHVFSAPGTYQVTASFYTTASTCEPIILTDTIEILPSPEAHFPGNLKECDGLSNDGKAIFDLAQQTPGILGNQSPDDYQVTYYSSEALAEGGEIFITGLSNYTNTENPQVVYVRVTNNTTGCFDLASFAIEVIPIPTITDPDDLIGCEQQQGEGKATFDLSATIPQITGGAAGVQVQFFRTAADMGLNIPIASPSAYMNSTPYGQTVYFKASAAGSPDCSATGELGLVVHPIPLLYSNIPDYVLCDDNGGGNGKEEFDLGTYYDAITSEPGHVLTYFYEQSGSLVVIDDPASFENTVPVQQTIFVSTSNSFTCENTTSFVVRVAPLPAIADAGPFYGCEEAPGQGEFDLNGMATAIIGGALGHTVAFYATLAQAESAIPDEELDSPHMSGTGTIYVVVKTLATGCERIVPVGLGVIPAPIANKPGALKECDTDGTNDGLFHFDLAIVEAEVLGAQDPSIHDITFYTSLEDAQAGENAIGNPSSYQSGIPFLQEIWVRLLNTSTANGCPDITSFLLHVEPLPEPVLEGGFICVDFETGELLGSYVLDSGLSAAQYGFEWYRDGVLVAGASTGTLEVTQAGSYSMVATSLSGGCVSEPLAPVQVEESGPASPTGTGYTVTNAFSDNPTITVFVQGFGEYRYSLDFGPYQYSNVFYNVSPGLHTVHVSADNSCDDLILHIEDIRIIDYPKFFTPNGDGYNDAWNISGLPDFPVSTIYIFDRYGKLLKQLDPRNTQGWDGTYNGAVMPSTDYWFTIAYPENGVMKEFKAHFALKR